MADSPMAVHLRDHGADGLLHDAVAAEAQVDDVSAEHAAQRICEDHARSRGDVAVRDARAVPEHGRLLATGGIALR